MEKVDLASSWNHCLTKRDELLYCGKNNMGTHCVLANAFAWIRYERSKNDANRSGQIEWIKNSQKFQIFIKHH